jgi:hypothetical protein
MAKSLSLHGFPTTVVAWKKGDVAENENFNGVEVERVVVSSDKWKRLNLRRFFIMVQLSFPLNIPLSAKVRRFV